MFESLPTAAVHAGRAHLAGAHVPAIDLSTTYPLGDVATGGDCYEALAGGSALPAGGTAVYQRLWNPGVARFEEAIAALEGTPAAVAFASGMAALSASLLATREAGRPHVVAVRPLYGGSDHLLSSGLLGTTVSWVRAEDVAGALRPDTGLVIVETPANPTLELVDLDALRTAAGDVPVLVDNTFATPVLQRPAAHGADLVLHSATKFIGGHGDVLAGVIACGDEWAVRLRRVRAVTGAILHPLAAYLAHRGLQTLAVRVRAAQSGATALAARLAAHPAVAAVHYPGLPGGDPAGLIGKQQSGPGAVLAFTLRGGERAAAQTAAACRLITHAVSLGGTDTLIQHPAALTHRPVTQEARPSPALLRLSVGLEDPEDLWTDLSTALTSVLPEHTPHTGVTNQRGAT